MEKDTARYTSKRIDIDSLLKKENRKLDIDNLLDDIENGIKKTPAHEIAGLKEPLREKEIRRISPGEYIVIMCMVITSLYLLVTSFFPLVYNIAVSFDPINFLMDLFYFLLGISVLAGAFLVFRKETHLEHIADDTFDKVIYNRLEPVLRDVAVVQVGLNDVQNQLEMVNLNIEKMGKIQEQITPTALPVATPAPLQSITLPVQISMYIKYIVLINITLAAFLFMLQYPQEYIPYAVTVIFVIWWAAITAEFKLWNMDVVWMWVFVPILVLPVYIIVMSAYLRDYQMFGSLFVGLAAYITLYYSWCSNMVRGVLPLDLHIALQNFRAKLSEKTQKDISKTRPIPRIDLKISFKLNQLATPLLIAAVILFLTAWFGFSIQHNLIPNVTWEALGVGQFTWKPLYSYAITIAGIFLLVPGIILKFWRRRY